MKVLLNIREALRALQANTLRSVLTMLGIVFGVAAVIVMVGIGAGTREEIREEMERLGVNSLVITPASGRAAGVSLGAASRATLTSGDARAIAAEVPDVVAAAPVVRGRVHLVVGNRNWSTGVQGTTHAFLSAREWQLADGRNFLPED
jgi:putative ABC transport system permease protein